MWRLEENSGDPIKSLYLVLRPVCYLCRGYVESGAREGECQVTCLEKGIRLLRGSYYNDRPEGFITLEREDGSWTEGFCLDGVWDGLVREFDSDRNIKVKGDC